MGFEPMTLRVLVGCSQPLSYCRLYDEYRSIFLGLDWNRIARLHSQVMIDAHGLTNNTMHIFDAVSKGQFFGSRLGPHRAVTRFFLVFHIMYLLFHL